MTRIDSTAQIPGGDLESGLVAHQAYTVGGMHFRYGPSRLQENRGYCET